MWQMRGTSVPFEYPLNICLDRGFAVLYSPTYTRLVAQSVPEYEQKTDRRQFELAEIAMTIARRRQFRAGPVSS